MPLITVKGLAEGEDLNRTDVIAKVCEVYKAVGDVDNCDMDSSLDDLGDDLKKEIIAKIGAYYNIDIDENEVTTCGDLVSYVMTHNGETTGDILNKIHWNSADIINCCDIFITASELARSGHSCEGFLGKIADTFLSMANTFKTNVFKFTKALKRSEIRMFMEGNKFLCRDVEAAPFTDLMELDVDIPSGMITTYANSTEFVKAVYEQLDAYNYGINVLSALKDLRYKMYNNNLDLSKGFSPASLVPEKDKVLKFAADMQTKCYKDGHVAPRMKFKAAYSSMEEFSGIKDSLLGMEPKLQDVNKFVDVMDDTSSVIGEITDFLGQNPVTPLFIQKLSDSVRVVGASFDLYGLNAMRQMALEHNHVINYLNLYKLL